MKDLPRPPQSKSPSVSKTHSPTINRISASTYLLRSSNNLRIPAPTEPPSEFLQPSCLVLLHVRQLLTARIPQRVVLGVFGRAVDRGRRGRAVQVCGAVGKRDHLRESVGPLGAAQQRGVADLRGEAAGGTARGSQGGAEERHCGFGWHF